VTTSAPYCDVCGESLQAGSHERCRERRRFEPPRYCSNCRRRMLVKVLPRGWVARCSVHGESSEGEHMGSDRKVRQHEVRTRDGRLLAVVDAGDPDGDLVLVHHGTPSSGKLASWWVDDAAARGIRLVGFDRPGYGASDRHPGRTVADVATDALAIADALGVGEFRTWGVSGGGPHALACAALLPDRILSAAALAPVAPYEAEGLDWFAGMGQDNLDEFGAANEGEEPLRPYLSAAREGMLAAGAEGLADEMRSLLPSADVAVLTGDVLQFMYDWIADGLAAGCEGWLDDDLAFVAPWGFDLDSIAVPVLLVQGRQDLMVPYAHAEWLIKRIPGVEPRLLEDQGHLSLLADLAPVHEWLLAH
jgi:pimeloyl-ACP methyl ester carboxylesterase